MRRLRVALAVVGIGLVSAGVALVWSYPVAMVVAGSLILVDRVTD